MAASSSSSALPWKYDVFINFRGEDTRRGFVSHLYRALCQKPINTFIDAEDLGKGDRISELLTAIRESRISIVVFSQNYASSTWCLKELVQILECKDTDNQIVLPIFYQVDPSDVRKLKRSFAEAFAHYNRDSNTQMEEVRSWISALTTATSLSGWDSRNFGDDAELIEKIVEDVFRKVIQISSTSSKENGLVGMDSHMHNMHLRLQLAPSGVDDVRVVGIWGMGGLGKTTIARAIYDEIACRFEASCFLENVKDGFMRHGKLHMQTELLSSISGNKVRSSDISNKGFWVMLKSLGQRKVLIVLDDVDKLEQIEALLGKQHSFGGGSRIIITTRDLELLGGADATYNPKIFSDPGALELFRWYAFRKNKPTRDYDDLSSRAVNYAQGLPLALKVLGSFLDNKTVREWEDFLEKLKEFPPKGINDVLRTSIDGLDRTEKNIFLDIACFFKGMNKDYAIEVLDSCGFYPHTGMRVLIDRALITVSVNGKLEMHDLLEEMGREIVRQESIKEPGRRSRLWSYEDVHLVLTQNKATKVVESIILDMSNSDEVCLNAEAFVSMTQLRLLKISHKMYNFLKYDYCKQHLIGHFKFLSRKLRCLTWLGFPLKSLPSNFQFQNLVDLDMQYSLIEQLWEGTLTLEKLKFINLSYCRYLKETPDFTKVPNIEKLILQSCTSLVEVHPSISTLANLVLLDLNGCRELKILASSIRMQSLETLDLYGCSSLEMFPEILEVMEKLPQLNLSGSKIKKLPSSINNLMGLRYLFLKDCKELKSLPSSISMKSLKTLDLSGCSSLEMFPAICTRSLEILDLSGCSSLKMFPVILEVMGKLLELNLSGLKIKKLPSSINNLTGLRYLNLGDCKELKSLPSNICMKSLETLDLSGCSSLEMFPAICTRSLKTLDLSGCSSLEMFPEILEVMGKLLELNLSGSKIKELPLSINNITELSYLNLKDCKELNSLPSSICQLKSLTYVTLSGCTQFGVFPNIVENMEGLRELHLDGTSIKELSPSIERLQGLEYLNLRNCKSLVHLPDTLCNLARLLALNLCGCPNLSQLPVNLVRLRDNGVELDNWHTNILTGIQHSQTSSSSTTEIGSESLTREQHSQTSSTSSKYNGLVEMGSHIHEMRLLLHPPGVETNDVRVVGIWGMGGIGKTTVARTVYDEIACRFEAHCFLENVKQGFMERGKLHMQTQLLSGISGKKVGSSNISDKGFQVLLKRLGQRKVLVVVDDVDDLTQIEALLGEQHSFGGGSKIIITTRDLQLLSGADAIYRPKFLSDPGALELLRRYAFRTNQPTSDYDDLLRRAVKYAQGLPLALKVLGAFLINRTVREWEDVLEKVRIIPQREIHKVLQTSFDGLDDTEKDIFLDIACFFKGMKKDYAIEILASCGFYPHIGLRVLIDRALITVSEEGELEMHDLLEKMGWEIVRQESIKKPGRRSRLCSYKDIHYVLTQNTARGAVESIILDLSNSDVGFINTNAFVCMNRLRLLKISHKYYICKDFYFVLQHLIGHLKFHSDELRCLSWIGFPLKSLPSDFRFKNLVDLDMQYSLIDGLWEGTQTLEKLKFINLSYCQFLKETPDFTKVPNLEQLILQNCMSLIEVHPSISTLTSLVLLNLNGCKKLKILASSIRMKSLKTLDLSGCSSLEMFPDILEVMEKLSALNLSRSKIKELPSSINNLTGLCYLDLKDCKELKSLPNNICQLKSLVYVTLSGCTKIEVFPNIVENMEGLRELHLDGTSIKELSPSIELLQGLEYLNLRNCKSLVHLPDTLCNLARLLSLNLYGCPNLSQLPVNLVRLWDNAAEIDNWHTDILTRVQQTQTSSASTTELRSESLTCEQLSQTSSTSSEDNGLVEMDSHMHEMHLLLHPHGIETNDVRVVGIWGMGGIGKTTVARTVYDEIACRFEDYCFLENVKEGFMKHGQLRMQTQLLSSISKDKVGSSDIWDKGFQVMLNSLGQRKVLIVIDDVDKLEQIEALLGEQHSSFGGGSRIIITTRDLQLLSGADAIYRPKLLSDPGALELLRRYAFRTNQPTGDYDDLLRRAVKYAQGLPLALKVLGAFLNNKTVREWEDVLEKVRIIPQRGIHDVLKTSFDGLDDIEKVIFLDIACFFKGMKKDYATEILGSCGFYPHIGIRVLIDRALITVSEEGELEMHDLLEKMGQEIVRQESIKEPGRRSRLWSYEDVHHALTQNTATEAVESIILDLSNSGEVCFNAEAFVRMTKLRLLKISHPFGKQHHLIGNLKFHSDELRCLSWIGFPLKSLPSNFRFENLVDLDMQYSLIDRLWEGTQTLEKLKYINLSYCQFLKETPDFTKVPNLERLILQNCMSLIEVHPSISTLTSLVLLNLNGCKKLKILASSIHMKSLETLDLSGCTSLEMFPEISEVMKELSVLNLSGSKIKELPSSINNLTGLSYLDLKVCKELKSLPSSICQLKSLTYVTLSGCTKFEVFPSIEENMERLRELHLDGTSIRELSPSIEWLQGLVILNLRDCKSLVDLPDTLCNLERLGDLNLCGCRNLSQLHVNFDIGHADIFIINHKLIVCYFIFSVIILVASLGVLKF